MPRTAELLPRDTLGPLPRDTVEPLLREDEPVPYVPELRVAADPLRVALVPVARTAEEPLREVPEAVLRATLVRPVEERRVAFVVPVVAVLPPARVRPLLRADEPPRETKLRELREPSRCPTWAAWLFRWIQRPLHPPTP